MLVRPDGERVQLLVRAPLEAMQDITFPTFGAGLPRRAARRAAAARCRAALARRQHRALRRRAARAAPRDRRRARVDSERSLVRRVTTRRSRTCSAPPLPAGIELPWQQALLDVQLEAPIESPSSLFSLRARTERLGMRVVNAVRFIGASGTERVFQIEGDAGVVAARSALASVAAAVPRAGLRAHSRRRRSPVVPALPRRAVPAATARARLDRHGVHGRALRDADRVGLWPGAERAVVPAARRDADRALDLLHGRRERRRARTRARVGRSRSPSGSCTASASRSRCRTRCSSPAITC